VLDTQDRPLIVHATPGGLALSEKNGQGWHTLPLVAEVPSSRPPKVLVEPSGAVHVLYWFTSDTTDQEIRHVYRGACPPP
jgi:hypothetical protein